MTPYDIAAAKLRPHERITRLIRRDATRWTAIVFSQWSTLYRRFDFTIEEAAQ